MKEGKYTYTNSQTLVMVFHLKDKENYISAFYIHLYMCVCIYIYRRRWWHPTPVLLPGKSRGRRSLVGCRPWGREEWDTTERLHFHFSLHALEKVMATHSSVFAWRIPGMAEPGGLPSLGSHRVGRLKRLSSSSSSIYICVCVYIYVCVYMYMCVCVYIYIKR